MSESAKPRMAVIGLGSMGFGMATSLRRAGFEVTGCDVSADSVARFVADGGKGARAPAEAAKNADVVVSVVVTMVSVPKPEKQLVGLVYSLTPKEDLVDPDEGSLPWYQSPVKLAGVGLVIVVVLNVIFR